MRPKTLLLLRGPSYGQKLWREVKNSSENLRCKIRSQKSHKQRRDMNKSSYLANTNIGGCLWQNGL